MGKPQDGKTVRDVGDTTDIPSPTDATRTGAFARLLEPLYRSVLRRDGLAVFLGELASEIRAERVSIVCQHYGAPKILASARRRQSTSAAPAGKPSSGPSVLGPIVIDAARPLSLWAHRSRRSDPFGREDVALVQALAPHLRRALRLREHASGLHAEENALAAVIESLPAATVLLRGDGSALFVNAKARRLLDRGDGLALGPAGLRAGRPTEQLELLRLVSAMANAGRPRVGAESLAVSRPSGKAPYIVTLRPATHHSRRGAPGAAVAFLVDPEAQHLPTPHEIVELTNLTAAQARLTARLCQGEKLAAAAVQEGMALETARMHLKTAFRSTGTHRQAELVGLVLRACAFSPLARIGTRKDP